MFKQRLLAKYVLADTQEATGPASKDWRIPKLPDDLKFPKTDRERRYGRGSLQSQGKWPQSGRVC